MSQQGAPTPASPEKNNLRVVSFFAAGAIGLVGLLVILYAWQLPPFTRHAASTDNAYVRGMTTFISPQVNGYITAVNVQDFAHVKQGDVLMTIDDRIYKQRVHQAQATLAMREAALANNLQQRRSAEATIAQNKAALASARAQSLHNQADLRRVKELTQDGSLSVRERDAAIASARPGQRQRRAGRRAARGVAPESAKRDCEPRVAGGGCGNARAALELAQIDLQNTRIIAPRDGQLGQIAVRQGGYVTAGTRLTSLVPPQNWVIANLKETQLADVKTGQSVTFTVDALNDEKFEGRVQSISPATGVEFSAITPDNATGNFVKIAQRIPVRIEVLGDAEKRARLRPGMSVQVTINTRSEAK